MDTSTTSEEELETSLETSVESIGNDVTELRDVTLPHRPSPFTLRSQCGNGRCPMGTGLYFRSRISPSPGKGRVRSRRRRRSDQSRMDTTDGANTTLDTTLDTTLEHHHHHGHHGHHHHHTHDHEHHQHDHDHLHHRPHHHHREEERHERSRPSRRKTKETTVTSSESRETTTYRTTTDSRSQAATQVDANGGIGGIAETVRNSVLGFFTPTKNTSLPAIVESSESGFEEGSLTGETVVASSPNSERFVSAREFFKEADTRERLTSDYFSGSDTPSKLRESTRRLSLCKPNNPYIAYSSDEEFDDWKQQPKSDYTYSTSLTYRDRVTPDRKIGSPNMSRRSLRGGNVGYLKSPDFSTAGLDDELTTSSLNLRNRAVLRSMDALSDTSDAEDTQEQLIIPRRRSSRSRSIDVMPKSNGTAMSRTITSSTYTTTRTLHRGLDADSDVDDGSESTVPIRATPLTARGGTPLGRSSTPLTSLRSRNTHC
nr:lateral signaling target protein 2 homolog [Penaeus vannamei]